MCAACKWNVQEGNDVRSVLQGGCQGQQQHQVAQLKPCGAQSVAQAEGGRLLGIAAGGEQKKGRREERKWRRRLAEQTTVGTRAASTLGIAAEGSRFTKWRARPEAQGRRSRSSNKETNKEWPITLDSPKLHDQALAWRRLFSQPPARPLPTPRLNLLGLEAQPQEPIQQQVSTLNSTPLCDSRRRRQSIAGIANIVSELAVIAVMRWPDASLPCPFQHDRLPVLVESSCACKPCSC
ncbi:hypothetical protein SVAN01_00305 [Stagonosporopsis vannaccii]|nr:hypothetical protein SVAN01_00305 [Stagonosporopsis vannaccii]